MALQYYNVKAKKGTPPDPIPDPPTLPVLNLTPLDGFLDAAHLPDDTGDPDNLGHGPRTIWEWERYRDTDVVPFKDGIWFYDFAAQSFTAHYYFQMRGRAFDQRWIDYANAWCQSEEKLCANAQLLSVYHFSGGLWMAHDYDPVTWPPTRVGPIISNYLNNINGEGAVGDINHERNSRERARVVTFLLDYWRMNGFNHPTYTSTNPTYNQWGVRYHNSLAGGDGIGAPSEGWVWSHMDEWLNEWNNNPQYPEHAPYVPGPDYPVQVDYAARAIDPASETGCAIFNLGPFYSGFTEEANFRLFYEDGNYQQRFRRELLLELIEFHYTHSWHPPSGTPGTNDQYGAVNHPFLVDCHFPQDAGDPIHEYCVAQGTPENPATNTEWGRIWRAEFDETPWRLGMLAWAWRQTGDPKYIERFDTIWDAMWQLTGPGGIKSFWKQTSGGKQYNRALMYLWPALILRGGQDELGNDIAFKCHLFPDGYPYQTPPIVDPTSV